MDNQTSTDQKTKTLKTNTIRNTTNISNNTTTIKNYNNDAIIDEASKHKRNYLKIILAFIIISVFCFIFALLTGIFGVIAPTYEVASTIAVAMWIVNIVLSVAWIVLVDALIILAPTCIAKEELKINRIVYISGAATIFVLLIISVALLFAKFWIAGSIFAILELIPLVWVFIFALIYKNKLSGKTKKIILKEDKR